MALTPAGGACDSAVCGRRGRRPDQLAGWARARLFWGQAAFVKSVKPECYTACVCISNYDISLAEDTGTFAFVICKTCPRNNRLVDFSH